MTTYSQMGCLIVRGASLFHLLVNTVPLIWVTFITVFVPNESMPAAYKFATAASLILNFLICFWLWIKAPALGIRMLDKPGNDSTALPFNYEHLQIVLLVTTGFLVLSRSFRPLLTAVPNIINYVQEESSRLDWRSLSEGALYLALGLLMIFTARGITRLVGAVRKL